MTKLTTSTVQTRYVEVDGSNIYVEEQIPAESSGSPSVVLLGGMGGTCISWISVQRLMPKHIRSFTYDRLGLGRSDRTELPRDAVTLAKEMRDTLMACEVPGPYLLVAHSYAGVIAREFLELYDAEVAGLIYVDANQENTHVRREWPVEASRRMMTAAFSTDDASGMAEHHRCTPEEWEAVAREEKERRDRRLAGKEPATGEWSFYESSLSDLGKHKQFDRQALGDRPLSVIVANLARDFERMFEAGIKAGLGTEEDHAVVRDFVQRLPAVELSLAMEVTKLSSLHRLIVTSVAGHLVYYWEPELIVQELVWCLDQLSRTAGA